jgi:transcriptional regulator with XRE-family HTH domain
MNYSKAIKIVRAARGLSQKELAKKAKIDASYVSLLECGRRKPSMDTLELLAQVLDVPAYLILLLASEKEELKGLGVSRAEKLGKQLLKLITHI